jgi:hypothetical protein
MQANKDGFKQTAGTLAEQRAMGVAVGVGMFAPAKQNLPCAEQLALMTRVTAQTQPTIRRNSHAYRRILLSTSPMSHSLKASVQNGLF